MIIKKKRYVIATREFPLMFDDGNGNGVDAIEDAYLHDSEHKALDVLNTCFDEPSEHQVIEVTISYEF